MVKFGTLEYYKALADAVNKDEELGKSNMNLTMIYHVLDRKLEDGRENRYFLKFENGRVVEVREAGPKEDADLVYSANCDIFEKVITGKLDAEAAERAGWFKLKYNLLKALKYRGAIERYSKVLSSLPTEF